MLLKGAVSTPPIKAGVALINPTALKAGANLIEESVM